MSSKKRSAGGRPRQTRTSTGTLQRPNYALKTSFLEENVDNTPQENATVAVERDVETDDALATALIDKLNAQTMTTTMAELKSQLQVGNFLGGFYICYVGNDGLFKSLNLQQISAGVLGSQVFGNFLRTETNAMKQLQSAKIELGDSCQKINAAIRAADKDLFRIQDLPIELRLVVWIMLARTGKGARLKSPIEPRECPARRNPALNMMLTCKWVYEEVKPVFYQQQTFNLYLIEPSHPMLPSINDNVRKASYLWMSTFQKDTKHLPLIANLKNLEEFELITTSFVFSLLGKNRNRLHQSESACAKFKSAHGFDALFRLKVSKLAIVKYNLKWDNSLITDKEIEVFKDFLYSKIRIGADAQVQAPLPTPIKAKEVDEDLDPSDGEYGKRPKKRARTEKGYLKTLG